MNLLKINISQKIENNKLFILLFIVFIHATGLMAQTQITDTDIKVAYIYRFTKHIDWQNHNNNADKFTIGVYKGTESIIGKFEDLAKAREIKGKTIEIIEILELMQIGEENIDILYTGNECNNEINDIVTLLKNTQTLLITDNCSIKDAIMINFLPSAKEEVVRFEIYKKNLIDRGFIVHPDILLLGGNFIDVRKLFHTQELALEQEKEKLKSSKIEVQKQNEIIKLQDAAITTKEKSINKKDALIESKNREIQQKELEFEHQKQVLNELSIKISKKEKNINNKKSILDRQVLQIKNQKISISATQKELKNQKSKIDEHIQLIAQQENVLETQFLEIKQQQKFVYVLLTTIFLVLGLVYFIYKSFVIKKKSNIKLQIYNNEILSQNDKITAQREEISRARDKLKDTNLELEKLSLVASKTSNAVLIAGADGTIEWVNDGFVNLYGYNKNEFIDKFGANIESASSHKKMNFEIEICKNEKRAVECLVQNISKDGNKLWIHSTLTPVLGGNKEIKKIIIIETNVSELKKAEENILIQKNEIEQHIEEIETQRDTVKGQNDKLAKYHNHLEQIVEERTKLLVIAKEKAEESDRLKSAFISNMSHEIRTPMNAVVGFSSLLGMDDLSKETSEEYVNIINSNALSLMRLIDDILDLSKMESGNLVIKKEECNIELLLNDLSLIYAEKIKESNLQTELTLKKDKSAGKLILFTDGVRLNQVLINLLDNAFKFTEHGEIQFGYSIVNNSTVRFFVKDNGIGIEKSKHKAIFDRFMKIENDNTKLYRGTGLGLAICKAIVNDLGGDINLESKQGHGAEFYFTLPLETSKN